MLKLTIHSTGTGTCSLSGKEGPGITVTFEDGTANNAFLTWKALQQLVAMKVGQAKKAAPAAVPVSANAVPAK
jgi:hypothetical protein